MRLHGLKCIFVMAVLTAGGTAGSAGIHLKATPRLQAITGMVARWPCDTITGGTSTPDVVSTNNLNFDAVGTAPSAVTGVFSNGIKLNGTDDFMAAADNPALNFGNGSFTVALWCRPANTAACRLINKWDGAAQQGWLLDTHSDGGGTNTVGSIRFRLDSDNTQNTAADNLDFGVAAGLDTGNWRHIAAVVDRTGATVKIYLDGIQVGANTAIPATIGSISNTFQLAVGTIPTSQSKWFNGDVDDIRLYNKALNAVEVDALYNGWYTVISVGNPGPVGPKRGLLGAYYNSTTDLGMAPTPSSPTSNIAPQDTNSTLMTRQLDRVINSDLTTARPATVNDNNFYVEWTGYIVTEAAGDYTITTKVDDGTRAWFNQNPLTTTPDIQSWTTQGPTPYSATFTGLAVQTAYPFRWEFFEGSVTQFAGLLWVPAGTAAPPAGTDPPAIPTVNLRPPAGPDAPTGLTATASTNSATPSVNVTWNTSTTPIAATSYVLSRSTTPGGPYTQIAVQTGTTFNDTGVVFGTTYYYIVQGTATNTLQVGPVTSETPGSTPTPPALTVSPTSGLATSEAPTNDTITLTVNVVPTSDVTVTVTSNKAGEVLLSGNGPGQPLQGPAASIGILIPTGTLAGTTITINVLGQDDAIDDGDQAFSISFAVSGGGTAYTGISVGPCTGTNTDNDTANLIISAVSGPTSEPNVPATFTIVFTTQPTVDTTVTIGTSDAGEGQPSPTTYVFTTAPGPDAWDQPHTITINGVDDNLLDFTQNYQITITVTAGDPVYQALTATPGPGPRIRNMSNLDDEKIPKLKPVWGGGCGLVGIEYLLPLGLIALWRRRRRNS
jgi:hypothetical protein